MISPPFSSLLGTAVLGALNIPEKTNKKLLVVHTQGEAIGHHTDRGLHFHSSILFASLTRNINHSQNVMCSKYGADTDFAAEEFMKTLWPEHLEYLPQTPLLHL